MPPLPFLLLLLCFLFSTPSLCDPRATNAAMMCTNRTAPVPSRQLFTSNLLAAMDALTPLISKQRYGAVVNGTGDFAVYAFGECMRDLTQSDCNICIAQCKTQVLFCLPHVKGTRGGRLFFDGCYLRYDDHNFFNETLGDQDGTVCGSTRSGVVYKANALELVRDLSVSAARNGGFAVGSVNRRNVSVYGLAQCWEPVNGSACVKCLGDAAARVGSCVPKEEGRALNAGCYLRYSYHKFYDNSTSIVPASASASASGNHGRRKLAIILALCFSGLALVLVVATIVFFVRKNVLKTRRERRRFGALLDTVNRSKLNMPYEILERATNYFNDAYKLGQGGSGSVYKGIMPDGNIVAIKRLSFITTQWADHFFNEVNLISGIHHKNLVRLLGCSITGPESLLVYEYVPNQSLHDHFSGCIFMSEI